jgi:hypothetical protein
LDFIDDIEPTKKAIHTEWENARDREKASRSRFAQHTLNPETVAEELRSVRTAIGHSEDVSCFIQNVLQAVNVPFEIKGKSIIVHLSNETPRALRQAIGRDESFSGRFDLPLKEGETYLGRTSPIVEGLAGWTLDQALDPVARDVPAIASRCGVISTSVVSTRTTLLLARFRYHLQTVGTESEPSLCEAIVPLAFRGPSNAPEWLGTEESERLLSARPERTLIPTAIEQQMGLLLPDLPVLRDALGKISEERSSVQLAAHERVREASKTRGRVSIRPVLPVDILGAYIILRG